VIPLVVSCYANPSSVNVGQSVTWTANVSGGNGNYSYSWNGAASGNGQTVYNTYSYAGTQNATVTVNSNGQTKTANCTTYVNQVIQPQQNLTLSCYANQNNVQAGQNVTWTAVASGGNGSYFYNWTGSNGLYGNGQTVNDTYYVAGTQTATVTVTSNGQSQTATCSTYVNQQNVASSVTVYTTPGQIPTSGVYLSQVPYTGLADSWKFWAFFAAIISFSAFAAYKMLRPKALANIEAATAGITMIPGDNVDMAALEAEARGKNILLSDDAISHIAEIARNEKRVASEVLSMIAAKMGAGNGSWTALSKEKIVGMN